MQKPSVKAIALMSGGLDSTLAAKLIIDQGIEVIGLHLLSPFGCRSDVEKNAKAINVQLVLKEKGEAYLDLIQNPKYGYGKNMNPCIDCRIFMFEYASRFMEEVGAHFIVTGEVLGQRPMSQRKDAMNLIDRKSDIRNLVLRPLSATLFPPTVPEIEGWVDRTLLLDIAGRGRKRQLELAKSFGIEDFDAPGGGCLLTEPGFSKKVSDFFKHDNEAPRIPNSELLRYGRHFRVSGTTKIIIGRNEAENRELESRWQGVNGMVFIPVNFSGPSAIVIGALDEGVKNTVGEMLVYYSKKKNDLTSCEIQFSSKNGDGTFHVTRSITEDRLMSLKI